MKNVWMILFLCVSLAVGFALNVGAEEIKPAATAGAPAAEAKPAPPPTYDEVGAMLPPVTMKEVHGTGQVALDKLGKPAFIMFINSTCAACRLELSTFVNLAAQNKAKLATYVVTVDFDPQNTVSRFPDMKNMPYTILDGSDYTVAKMLGFNFTPATVIADASGKQTFRKGGYSQGDDMLIFQEIKKVLK